MAWRGRPGARTGRRRPTGTTDGPPPPRGRMRGVTEAHLVGTFEQRADRQLQHRELPLVLGRAMDRLTVSRAEAWAGYDLQAIRRTGEAIRSHTIVNLPDYLDRFASAASER